MLPSALIYLLTIKKYIFFTFIKTNIFIFIKLKMNLRKTTYCIKSNNIYSTKKNPYKSHKITKSMVSIYPFLVPTNSINQITTINYNGCPHTIIFDEINNQQVEVQGISLINAKIFLIKKCTKIWPFAKTLKTNATKI